MSPWASVVRIKAEEGHAFNEQGDFACAREAFLEALTLCPDTAASSKEKATLLFSAANMSFKLNELDEARRLYHKVLWMRGVDPSLSQRVHEKLASPLLSSSAPAPAATPTRPTPSTPATEVSLMCGNPPSPSPTTTHEPSWMWKAAGDSLVDHVLRPRVRLGPPTIQKSEAELIYRQCVVLGHAANAHERYLLAQSCFESAYQAKEDSTAFISAINMRLKMGQCTLACSLYQRLLVDARAPLTTQQAQLVGRKLREAAEAIRARTRASTSPRSPSGGATPLTTPVRDEITGDEKSAAVISSPVIASPTSVRITPLRDEMSALVAPLPQGACTLTSGETDEFLRLLRRQGHGANEQGDADAALHAFEVAFAVSRSPSDLLSAANMRVKLVDTSTAAEALYNYLLSLGLGWPDGLSSTEAHVASRQLEAIRERRRERKAQLALAAAEEKQAAPREAYDAAKSGGEPEFMSWLAKTALSEHQP